MPFTDEKLTDVIVCQLSTSRVTFCHFFFRRIYYCHSSKSTKKETGKTHLCAAVCQLKNKENPTLCNVCCLHSRKAMQQRRHNGRFGIILSKIMRSLYPLNPRNICFGIHLYVNRKNISNYQT